MKYGLTKRSFIAGCACACCTPVAGIARAEAPAANAGNFGKAGLPTLLELGTNPMQRLSESLWVARIAPGFWLHTTTATTSGGYVFPANGLILERSGGSLLIDTGYTAGQARDLANWAKMSLAAPITKAIGTHFHNDRIGGVDGLKQLGIPTYAFPLTVTLAKEHAQPVPQPISGFVSGAFRLDEDCELFFPGAGHTRDNITAWFPRQQILFGGCFLKSSTNTNLGNIADAVVPDWAASVQRLIARHHAAAMVIPGHGTMAGNAIVQTLGLLTKTSTGHG
jgi:glyoxylase-like metal-dependent hydrolase (beta-lactamase superfamily II)